MARNEKQDTQTQTTSTAQTDAANPATTGGATTSDATPTATTTTTTTTTAAQPVNVLATQNDQLPPQFSFEVSQTPTNRMQYATNREDRATISALNLTVLRGEVIDVTAREKAAAGLRENGLFAYVSNDTPLGQPDEFKPQAREKKTAPATEPK